MKFKALLFISGYTVAVLLFNSVNCENDEQTRQGRILNNRKNYDTAIEQQLIQEYPTQNATEATADELIDEIIDSSRQGRNVEGLEAIYDLNINEALNNGNENEARNLIRDKLCDLGLMQCDELIPKRPQYPTRVIYTQPPPGAQIYSNRPMQQPQYNNVRPPIQSVPQKSGQIYGPAKPMPLPHVPQNQPPRKIGFASELNSYESSSNKFNNYYERDPNPSSIKFGYTEKPTIVVNQGKREASNGLVQNHHVHHHYVHVDGNSNGGLVDGSKTVLVNTPISEYSAVDSLSSSYQTSGFGTSGASSNLNGFTPMSATNNYEYKGVNSGQSSYQGLNSGNYQGIKPVYEGSNQYATGTNYNKYTQVAGPAVYTEGSNGVYNPSSSQHAVQGSFHATSPEFHKKELNLNGYRGNGLTGSGYASQQQQPPNSFHNSQKVQQQQQHNSLYSKNPYAQNQGQDQSDCVCVPFDQCPAQDIVGRRDDLVLPLDPRNLPTEIEAAESDNNSTTVKSANVTIIETKKISKRAVDDVQKVQGEGAPGTSEGSEKVSFPTSRRRRDTDQPVPASVEEKHGDHESSIESEDSEGRAINTNKRQAFYQPQKQCGPRAVCCRRPFIKPAPVQYNRCGVRSAQGINGRIKNPVYVDGNSEFGEWPWQAAILKKDPKESVYVCGGTLISDSYVITAVHCIKSYNGFDLRVRLGEWDVNHDVEFYPYVEKDVISVHVHPDYYAGTLDNDIAILKLSSPIDLNANPHITPACLPDRLADFSGTRCWTTGWGKDNWEYGKYQNILKEVDVPVIDQNTCQQQLRQTRLGYSYNLNPGFMCAGGEEGKDACKGDGGGPLVCERNGVWSVAGIVSWGIGCGQQNVPGVYVRVSHYLNWIQQITRY